ncbi:hypothetical protein [Microbispora sp. NPDC049125]
MRVRYAICVALCVAGTTVGVVSVLRLRLNSAVAPRVRVPDRFG